jgi:hypothetical protein
MDADGRNVLAIFDNARSPMLFVIDLRTPQR